MDTQLLLLILIFLYLLFTKPKTETLVTGDPEVKIIDFEYSPKDIKIKKGSTITWTNYDEEAHTVTSEDSDDPYLDSPFLEVEESFSKKFNKKGTFYYYCVPHPYMKGSVTVV